MVDKEKGFMPHHRSSTERLSRMPIEELSALHDSLQGRRRVGRGGKHLDNLRRNVEGRLRERERRGNRKPHGTSEGGQDNTTLEIAGRQVLYARLNGIDSSVRGLVVEAHPDDRMMAEGIDGAAVRKGVGMTVVTLTDGGARQFPNIMEGEWSFEAWQRLPQLRWQESIASVKILNGDEVYNVGIPDGELSSSQPEAIVVLSEIILKLKPAFIIAPHPGDPHPDHSSAYEVASAAANGEIPVYAMDTIMGLDRYGNFIIPTHYVPLSRREDRRRNRGFDAHATQVKNLQPEDRRNVDRVKGMTRRRGRDIGVPFAGSLVFDATSHNSDPIAEIFTKEIVLADH